MTYPQVGNEIDHLGYAEAELDYRRGKLRRFTVEALWTLAEVAFQLAAFAGGAYLIIRLGGIISGQIDANL
jgi:hypothetical protein